MKLCIGQTWDGNRISPEENSIVQVRLSSRQVAVGVEAPFFNDPPPTAAPGRLGGLWNHEVVELFLLGSRDRYLEIELGPYGHYLAISLSGRRQVDDDRLTLDYTARISGDRWEGRAVFPASYLPAGVQRVNAYAIHGAEPSRRYLAAFPCGGIEPDFHRLECFAEIDLQR